MILLLADLRVTTFEPTAADEDNAAYAALRDGPSGRVLEVPIFRPGIHFGGVYLYYSTQAQRKGRRATRRSRPWRRTRWPSS